MRRLQKISVLSLIVLAFTLGSCTQDSTMDEIIDNTEINAPSPSSDENGGTSGEEDTPGGK